MESKINWEEIAQQAIDIVLKACTDVVTTVTLPTGKQLISATIYAGIIAGASVASRIFTPDWCFIDWRGAVLAVLILGSLLFVERRGYVEVSRLYRIAKSRAGEIAQRAKRPSADVEDVGDFDAGEPMH